jgi:pyruvate,water dikinase
VTVTDPTSGTCAPDRYWTTANIGEATPDVVSALCWSFWGPQAEAAARRAYHAFGILSRHELAVPASTDDLLTGWFFGRPALNVDVLRPLFGSLPGVSADDFERDLCGEVRPGLPEASRRARLPIIVVRGVGALRSTPRRLAELAPRQRAWWEREVRDRTDPGDPLARLDEAAARFREAFEIHCCGRFVLLSAQSRLVKLATAADRLDLILPALGGLGGVAEAALADDLWQVGRGELTLEAFVARHGFHGPNEGNVATRSWREDPTPLRALVAALADRPDDERPRRREAAVAAAHAEAIGALEQALTGRHRRAARRAGAALARSTRANELGKACFLMALDGARAAARDLGRALVADGRLDDVEDVFAFTIEELHALPADARTVAAVRTKRRAEYREMRLPVTFTGVPELLAPSPAAGDGGGERTTVTGAAGATGRVEGTARVVLDPATAPALEPGEVLVCRFTDPSWTPLLLLADAVVIDIGGPASHGAIVARELGVPCVIGTGNGTSVIRTGDRLAVDGGTGVVTILARAGATSTDAATEVAS